MSESDYNDFYHRVNNTKFLLNDGKKPKWFNAYSNPNSIRPFIELKGEDDVPRSTSEKVFLLDTDKIFNNYLFGTYARRSMKYPGDVDTNQGYVKHGTIKKLYEEFVKDIKKTVKKIQSTKYSYMTDFKAGLDNRFDVNIGTMIEGTLKLSEDLFEITTDLHKQGLLNIDEWEIIIEIISRGPVIQQADNDYDILKYIFREHTVLRWNEKEILAGKKILPGNVIMPLSKALRHKTFVKIDIITLINGKFLEVTNFFMFILIPQKESIKIEKEIQETIEIIKPGLTATKFSGPYILKNIDLKNFSNEKKIEGLKRGLLPEIEKWYYSNMYYSPLKSVKRMYSLAAQEGNDEILRATIPILQSNASMLYQIKSEIDSILLILNRKSNPPMKIIDNQIDEMCTRIASVTELNQDATDIINEQVKICSGKFIGTKNKETAKEYTINNLKILKKMITPIINYLTIKQMNKYKINPPPRDMLPPELKYSDIVRRPYDNPINPLS